MKFNSNVCIALLLLVLFAGCAGSPSENEAVVDKGNPSCPDPDFSGRSGEEHEIMVPLRDCVHLSTIVSTPDTPGPWPVIMIRTPYGKGGEYVLGFGLEDVFTAHGYAVVEQDVRGRFDSEGEFVPFLNERADAADVMAWLERQDWFDGKLGVWGASYLGATAMLATVERPDLVKGAFIAVVTSNIWSVLYEHGLLKADMGGAWALMMHDKNSLTPPDAEDHAEAMLNFPFNEADQRTVGSVAFDDPFFAHNTYDSLYLDQLKQEEWHNIDVPLYFMTGWFDFMAEGQLDDWGALWKNRSGRDLFLTIGPWNHLMGFQPTHDYEFPNYGALPFYFNNMVKFFDTYVREEKVQANMPAVEYYDGGTGEWSKTTQLWPQGTHTETWYASGLSGSPSCAPIGKLQTVPTTTAESVAYSYNPNDSVILNGAMVLDTNNHAGMQQEIDWCARPDALLFETEEFAEQTELAGDIKVNLKVSSDAADSAFFARLSLVDVDGQAYNLREGAMILSFRESDFTQTTYTPDSIVNLRFAMPALRWTLQPGQKLRLAISNSGYPFVAPHPNVDGDYLFASEPVIAEQTVYAGGKEGTSLTLTIAGKE